MPRRPRIFEFSSKQNTNNRRGISQNADRGFGWQYRHKKNAKKDNDGLNTILLLSFPYMVICAMFLCLKSMFPPVTNVEEVVKSSEVNQNKILQQDEDKLNDILVEDENKITQSKTRKRQPSESELKDGTVTVKEVVPEVGKVDYAIFSRHKPSAHQDGNTSRGKRSQNDDKLDNAAAEIKKKDEVIRLLKLEYQEAYIAGYRKGYKDGQADSQPGNGDGIQGSEKQARQQQDTDKEADNKKEE